MSATSLLSQFFSQLIETAQARSHRQLVVSERSVAETLLALGEASVRRVGSQDLPDVISWRQTKQWLGQECGHLLVDVDDKFNSEAFCAISGCCRAGSLIILQVADDVATLPLSVRRMLGLLQNTDSVAWISHQGWRAPTLPPLSDVSHLVSQQDAINGLKKVVTGHRRRPLLLTADRGRGKSAAMGIAAAQLALQAPRQIVVTSPTPANVTTLFAHAKQQLGTTDVNGLDVGVEGSRIRFVAPDALLRECPDADLLLVDEAAAIPLPMISQILRQYSRVAIASTEHGYEGTGRAFTLRLRALLDEEQPQWRSLTLTEPMRWAEGDPVETCLNQLFLLNVAHDVIPPKVEPCADSAVQFKTLSAEHLFHHEQELVTLFSLLMTAHYQTSPNDLALLLDDDSLHIVVAKQGEYTIGVVVVAEEGGFSTPLSEAVIAGTRRIRGHLLAQSLATHLGDKKVLENKLWRIQRIAVAPEWRRHGVASGLLTHLQQQAAKENITCIGTSFGATKALIHFWQKQGFEPVKLGMKRDQASGCYSLQLIRPVKTMTWMKEAVTLFQQSLPLLLMSAHQNLEPNIAATLVAFMPARPLTNAEARQVQGYAAGGVGTEAAIGSLQAWTRWTFQSTSPVEWDWREALLTSKVLQGLSWQIVCARFNLSGKKAAEKALRDYVAFRLDN
ncbi:GNAT family N-acetyltransferase [Salinivibrio sp. PR919]|uniref:GNAT family N-acetyltransferase n=1 Tax=Salinivibrio sp. PR919 TaxID=1909491 RepID=UPI000987528D|nr:GNAT family N-acetyltransferase [Salinivibrio sp. PR919]OOF12901.1 hypothetical protein BZG83_10280 [Salinivibrio sp. PR919]